MDGTVQTTQVELKGEIVYIPEVDKTLTKDGYSADAKVTGDRLDTLAEQMGNLSTPNASLVSYNNTNTDIESVTVQGAITELNGKIGDGVSEEKLVEIDNALTYFDQNMVTKNGSSMINGTLMLRNADNGYGSIMKNNSTDADYGTQLADLSKSGKNAKITVNALSNLLTFTDADGEIRNIHHEGNKRFVTYIGNGSIGYSFDTKSIGRFIIMYGDDDLAFVTPKGALTIKLTDGSIKWLDGSIMYYVNGMVHFVGPEAGERFNINGDVYYIQAI